jgi:cyanophycin synthetase
MTREEVEAAFVLADAEGSEVIVERFVRGSEHRLLVVGNKLVAAARGETVFLVADGASSIRKLIDEQINTDPRRGEAEVFPLDLISVDTTPAVQFELARQGYTADSVPSSGIQVLIQRNGNVACDVTDLVHPEVAATVALAARIVGLDIAGVDLVAEDISKPLAEQGGAIVEINAGPGLLMHLKPASGEPRPVGRAIVDSLFSQEDSGRIPVVGITGSHGKTQVARIIARLLKLAGKYVGLACSEGLYFDRRLVDKRNCATWGSAQKVLLNRSVEAAVIENSFATILSEGLGYDRCQVGVVTNIDAGRHFGEYYIENEEQVCNVLRTQVDVVLSGGVAVLNAADSLVAEMAKYCDGEVIFFSIDGQLGSIADHLGKGGRAVLMRDGHLVLKQGEPEMVLLKLAPVLGAECNWQLENVLAAVAAAWALGISTDIVRAGIATFEVERALPNNTRKYS